MSDKLDLNVDNYDIDELVQLLKFEKNPINEDILGCDKVSYRHIYYIAKLKHENIVLSCENKNQLLEISDIVGKKLPGKICF